MRSTAIKLCRSMRGEIKREGNIEAKGLYRDVKGIQRLGVGIKDDEKREIHI